MNILCLLKILPLNLWILAPGIKFQNSKQFSSFFFFLKLKFSFKKILLSFYGRKPIKLPMRICHLKGSLSTIFFFIAYGWESGHLSILGWLRGKMRVSQSCWSSSVREVNPFCIKLLSIMTDSYPNRLPSDFGKSFYFSNSLMIPHENVIV